MDYFITDSGHYFDYEDLNTYAMYRVKELKEDEYSKEELLLFFDNREWKRIAHLYYQTKHKAAKIKEQLT